MYKQSAQQMPTNYQRKMPPAISTRSSVDSEMLQQRMSSAVLPQAYASRHFDKADDSSPIATRPSYRKDYSRAQHPDPQPYSPMARKELRPVPKPPSPMTTEQQRFNAFMNRFSAHDPSDSPIRRNPNRHQPPSPNYHATSVSERIKRFGELGGYSTNIEQEQRYPDQNSDCPDDTQGELPPGFKGIAQPTSIQPIESPKSSTREIAQRFEQPSASTLARNLTPTSSTSSAEQRQPRTERLKPLPPLSRPINKVVNKSLEPPSDNGLTRRNKALETLPRSSLPEANHHSGHRQNFRMKRDSRRTQSEIPDLETLNTLTIKELKRQLWDEKEKLQVAVQPSLKYNATRASRSLSPARPQYASANKQPVFKSKFYEAAVAARKSNTRPPMAPESPSKPLHMTSPKNQGIPMQHATPKIKPAEILPQGITKESIIQPHTVERTASGTMESTYVSMLVARLNAISRADPATALTQIDSILRNESKSVSEADPSVTNKELERDEDDSSVESDDDETSVSAITDPTYMSGRMPIEDASIIGASAVSRNRPNSLQYYTNIPPSQKAMELKAEQKKRDRKNRLVPPPATINVNTGNDAMNREKPMLDTLLNKSVDSDSAAAIALKIRLWDEMSQPRLDTEDAATAVTEELGSLMTRTIDTTGGSWMKQQNSSLQQESNPLDSSYETGEVDLATSHNTSVIEGHISTESSSLNLASCRQSSLLQESVSFDSYSESQVEDLGQPRQSNGSQYATTFSNLSPREVDVTSCSKPNLIGSTSLQSHSAPREGYSGFRHASVLEESPSLSSSSMEFAPRRKHAWDVHHPKHRVAPLTPRLVETSMDEGVGIEIKPVSPNRHGIIQATEPQDDSCPVLSYAQHVLNESNDVHALQRQLSQRSSASSPVKQLSRSLVRCFSQEKEESVAAAYSDPVRTRFMPPSLSPSNTTSRFSLDHFGVDPMFPDIMTQSFDARSDVRDTISASNSDFDTAWVELPPSAFFVDKTPALDKKKTTQKPEQRPSKEHVFTSSKSFDTSVTTVSMGLSWGANEQQEPESHARRFRLGLPKRTPPRANFKSSLAGNSMEEVEPLKPPSHARRARSEPGVGTQNSNFAKKLTRLMRR